MNPKTNKLPKTIKCGFYGCNRRAVLQSAVLISHGPDSGVYICSRQHRTARNAPTIRPKAKKKAPSPRARIIECAGCGEPAAYSHTAPGGRVYYCKHFHASILEPAKAKPRKLREKKPPTRDLSPKQVLRVVESLKQYWNRKGKAAPRANPPRPPHVEFRSSVYRSLTVMLLRLRTEFFRGGGMSRAAFDREYLNNLGPFERALARVEGIKIEA